MTGFYKLSGAGNDFLALVEPEAEPRPEKIRAWCARGVSLGADGLFTLARREGGGARMIHYNPDGGRSELCVNGTRCAARLAFHLGWAADAIAIHTDSGTIPAARRGDAAVELEIEPPADAPDAKTLELGGETVDGWYLRVGVPHFVIAWQGDLETAPVAAQGPALRAHPALGPAGANVHWVDYAGAHRFTLRSFERGVEAETLACGSGVLAAVAVGLACGRCSLPVEATVRSGFDVRVAAAAPSGWTLAGDARLLAEGRLLAGSAALPPGRDSP